MALSGAGPKRAVPCSARGDEGTTTRSHTRVDHLSRLRGAAEPARCEGLTFTQEANRRQRGRLRPTRTPVRACKMGNDNITSRSASEAMAQVTL